MPFLDLLHFSSSRNYFNMCNTVETDNYIIRQRYAMNICRNCHFMLMKSKLRNLTLCYQSIQCMSLHQNAATATEISWQPVIGLEIHAQMNTASKLFSQAKNQFMAPPNSLVSDFDASLPGTLPVLNKRCVEAAVLTSLALGCKINRKSYFDRKHYFYADLPQGYQITQYWKPIAENGSLSIPTTHGSKNNTVYWKKIQIERIQIEQDSGKSLHDDKARVSLIDLNRAGVGLMEIVTAPDFQSAEEAATFVLDLMLTMKKLETCKGNIAEGNLRVDANISLHLPGEPLGVRSEVKNIAGISALVSAINFEISRHKKILNDGGQIVNETREYNSERGITVSMRDKEEFQDYRFMPEPNLPPLILYSNDDIPDTFDPEKQINIDKIREHLQCFSSPAELRGKLFDVAGMTIQKTSFFLENQLAGYFLEILQEKPCLPHALVSNWMVTEVLGLIHNLNITIDECPIRPAQMAELLTLQHQNDLDHTSAVKVFDIIVRNGGSPEEVMRNQSLKSINDVSTIKALCSKAIEDQDHEKLFKKYRRGEYKRPRNKTVTKLIVNAVLQSTDGKAHAKITQSVARELLDHYYVQFHKSKRIQ